MSMISYLFEFHFAPFSSWWSWMVSSRFLKTLYCEPVVKVLGKSWVMDEYELRTVRQELTKVLEPFQHPWVSSKFLDSNLLVRDSNRESVIIYTISSSQNNVPYFFGSINPPREAWRIFHLPNNRRWRRFDGGIDFQDPCGLQSGYLWRRLHPNNIPLPAISWNELGVLKPK